MEAAAYHYNSGMERFTYPEDRYDGWVLLAAQSGRFAFTLECSGEPIHGEAEFGDLVVCPPGTVFKRRMLTPTSFHFAELVEDPGLPPGKNRIRDAQRLLSTFDYLIELRAERPYGLHEAIGHLLGDLVFLADRVQHAAKLQQRTKSDPLVDRIAACIREEACLPEFSLQAMAARFGLRGSQLSLRFQAVHDSSPIQYATSIRLSEACRLLVETDDTLEAIAARCGYENGFYLSRVFSKHMGTSPSAFRRANKV